MVKSKEKKNHSFTFNIIILTKDNWKSIAFVHNAVFYSKTKYINIQINYILKKWIIINIEFIYIYKKERLLIA